MWSGRLAKPVVMPGTQGQSLTRAMGNRLLAALPEDAFALLEPDLRQVSLPHGSSRLCRWLLQCADRIGSEQLLLTQEFLAEMLGVRRTTVTLLAQELQKRCILRYSRGRITIIDRAALEACACECYKLIRKVSLGAVPGVPRQSKII